MGIHRDNMQRGHSIYLKCRIVAILIEIDWFLLWRKTCSKICRMMTRPYDASNIGSLSGRRSPDSHPYSTRAALAIWWIAVRFHDAITNIAKINVVWQNQQWSKMHECLISNRFDCRWEKQSLQRRTSIESIPFNVFQRIEQWNEAKGNTTFKSTPFNLLDFVIHDDRHEVNIIIVECLLWHCYRR